MENVSCISTGESDYIVSFLDILHLQSVCNRGREKAIRLIETSRNIGDLTGYTFPYIRYLNKLEKDLLEWRNQYEYWEGTPDNRTLQEKENELTELYEQKFLELNY